MELIGSKNPQFQTWRRQIHFEELLTDVWKVKQQK